MAGDSPRDRSRLLFQFDHPYNRRYHRVAGVDEAGRGPLAGPVVAAAVILPHRYHLPRLDDSKRVPFSQRFILYAQVQRVALAIGVGIVEPLEIDRVNILQATYAAMRVALAALAFAPEHILVDGWALPDTPYRQTALIGGDSRSASIAAASIVAKVTRDCLMESWDRQFPAYGFKQHKGYGTARHLAVLKKHGPCTIHRRSFQPVAEASAT